MDLPIPASIPSDYIADRRLRLQLYRRLAGLSEEHEVEAVGAELADRFGALPPAAENLLYQLKVKLRAGRAGAEAVASEMGQIVISMPAPIQGEQRAQTDTLQANLGPGVRVSKNRIWLARATNEGDWRAQLLEVLAKLSPARESDGQN